MRPQVTIIVALLLALFVAGTAEASSVSGIVYEEGAFAGTAANWDGGTNDVGIDTVDVELYQNDGTYITSMTTAGGGLYSFSGLADATYKVRVRSATLGTATAAPKAGLNGSVGTTYPYPIPTMTWANTAAKYGGQSATADDTSTGDNAGPGNRWIAVTLSGSDVPNVNFGFAYNLIVNADDDANAANVRSKAGTLRQYIKNMNAFGAGASAAALKSQFRMQVATNQVSGSDTWWRITLAALLPNLSHNGITLDASTQRASVSNTNTKGPEIEIYGNLTGSGVVVSNVSGVTVREFTVNGFYGSGNGQILITGASATGNGIYGNYLCTDALGASQIGGYSGIVDTVTSGGNNDFGSATAGDGNLIAGCGGKGIEVWQGSLTGDRIKGNKIGTDRLGTSKIAVTGEGIYLSTYNAVIGGATGGNIISGCGGAGINIDYGKGSIIQGNSIGVGAVGTETTLGNTGGGLSLNDAAGAMNLQIGGYNAGEGNVIARNPWYGVYAYSHGDNVQILGNTIRNNTRNGIYARTDGMLIARNQIYSNGGAYAGIIVVNDGATNTGTIYQNVIYGNGSSGISTGGSNPVIKNNIIASNTGYGINKTAGAMTESYNLINGNTTAGSNVALSATDRTVAPAFVNAGAGNFALTECTSPAINRGLDLGGSQPDMNGVTAGLYTAFAPDMGAIESACTGYTLSGTVYTDEGSTNIGAGKIVRLIVNGYSEGTATTNGSGAYTMSAQWNGADPGLVYIDGDATYKGVTATVLPAGNLANVNIYASHVITRHDNSGSMTNALMSTALGAYSDTDILYSVAGGNLTVSGAGTELYVPTGNTFAPGGNVTTPALEVAGGTLTGGAGTFAVNGDLTISGGALTATSGTMTVSGNFVHTAGTFTHSNGSVTLDGTNQTISGSSTFYDLTKTVASAATLTFPAGSTQTIAHALTLQGASGQLLSLRSSSSPTKWNLTLNPGVTKSLSYLDVMDSDASGSDASVKPMNPANTTNSGNNVGWFGFKISGRVFEDANFAGTASGWDGGGTDLGLDNVDVELYANDGSYLASVNSSGGGTYLFDGYNDNTYKVRVRSATIGDADTPPKGGLNGSVGTTYAYPIPTMTWGAGSAKYGGQSATADDTSTGDNGGPGNTWVSAVVSGADTTGVDFGFAYNLIVSADDDGNAANVRSKAGTLRQFLKNVNALNSPSGTEHSSQFRMQVATNQGSGDTWWRIPLSATLPAMVRNGTTLDGSTQRLNVSDTNSAGPEIELYGNSVATTGLIVSGATGVTIRELTVNGATGTGVSVSGASSGTVLSGNVIRNNGGHGFYNSSDGVTIVDNRLWSNGGSTSYHGIWVEDTGGNPATKVYHNTVHASGGDGIRVGATSTTIRNNIVTGSGGYGINRTAGSMTADHNLVTDATTSPANSSGRSNVSLDATDRNANPLFVNATTGNFTLTECTSPSINRGVDLGSDQPDQNGATAGNFNGDAPDQGALESSCAAQPRALTKRAFRPDGTPIASGISVPKGALFKFLLYINNTGAARTDVQVQDILNSAFEYQAGTMKVSDTVNACALDNCTSSEESAIFTATESGSTVTDVVDGDVASYTAGSRRIDAGKRNVANAQLDIAGWKMWALSFTVKMR